jgi:Bacterial CdiA-CT RNAse A domain
MLRNLRFISLLVLALGLAACGGSTVPSDFPVDSSRSSTAEPKTTSEARSRSSSSAAARYDLSKDEGRGHTLAKHVGRSDEELRGRLDRERNISAASTWTDRDAAEETIGEALQKDQGRITQWEERGERRPNLALHFDAGRTIGRSMRHGDSTSVPCTAAVIVLKADGSDSFYVLTAYPEDRQ